MTLVFKPYHQSRFVDWPQDEEIRVSDLDALLALPKFKAISERPDFFRFSRGGNGKYERKVKPSARSY